MGAVQAGTKEVSGYKWKPIEPLSEQDKKIDLAGISALYSSWDAARTRIERSGVGLHEFNAQLIRRLSIESGILERLYDLDRGTTETLVTHGFAENLIARGATNIEPSSLIDILKDQEAAIEHAMSYVEGKRPLTKAFIHELHAMLLQHQDSTVVIDSLGNKSERPLLKGKYKEHPNNPRRPDGSLHEYCPPFQVETEMDNLLRWYGQYTNEDPVIVASWLHHRFAQIHPYQDGNGRLARILTTMVLVHKNLLPIVVEREDRTRYIDALERADTGDLSVFASMLASLEKDAILRALSVETDVKTSLTAAVIESIKEKEAKKQAQKHSALRKVNDVARSLQKDSSEVLRGYLDELKQSLSSRGRAMTFIDEVKPGDAHSHWYKSDVIESAKAVRKFVNFAEDHYFTKAAFEIEKERFDFIVSFHHIGRELSGIMEATAFFRLKAEEDDASPAEFHISSQAPIGPFVFTNQSKHSDIKGAFLNWLDEVFAPAIKQYAERL